MDDAPISMIFDPKRLIRQAIKLEKLCDLYKSARVLIVVDDTSLLIKLAEGLTEKFKDPRSYQEMLMQKIHRQIYLFAIATSDAHLQKIDETLKGLIQFMEHSAQCLRETAQAEWN